jgi:hypothetical protein
MIYSPSLFGPFWKRTLANPLARRLGSYGRIRQFARIRFFADILFHKKDQKRETPWALSCLLLVLFAKVHMRSKLLNLSTRYIADLLDSLGRHFGCQLDGAFHGAGVGSVAADDIEGGSVIRTGANDGQADGEVDRLIEGQQFDRDQALVVVHGDHQVVLLCRGLSEDGVCGKWATYIHAMLLGHIDGGLNDALLFIAKSSIFRGVGVQAAHGDARLIDAQLSTSVMAKVDGVKHAADGQDISQLHQRHMGGGKDHIEFRGNEHHGSAFGLGAMGEQFCVAWETATGQLPGFLADRCGHDRVEVAWLAGSFHRSCDGVIDELKRGVAGLFGWFVLSCAEHGEFIVIQHDHIVGQIVFGAGGVVLKPPPEGINFPKISGVTEQFIEAIDHKSSEPTYGRIRQGFDHHFRADASGVAHGDADDRSARPSASTGGRGRFGLCAALRASGCLARVRFF